MADGSWRHGPASRRVVLLDKERSLVQLDPLDHVVHAAVGQLLSAALDPRLSDQLYSYRKGRGPTAAIQRLLEVAAAHCATRPDPRTRALWVIRFDVASYGDSVPIDDSSELWTLARRYLPDEPPWVHEVLRALVRCAAHDEFADHGIPNGSPITTPMLNLYLADLDHEMSACATTYLRYGDDVAMAFERAEDAEAALAAVEATIARKGLSLNATKLGRLYWTAVGLPARRPGWTGVRHVPFVGHEVGLDGVVRAKTVRRRELVVALTERLRGVVRLLDEPDPLHRARALCQTAAALLDPASPLVLPELEPFLRVTSCRIQLTELDRQIATQIAGLATGIRGPKSFRRVSWRSLHQAGLPSLTAVRNHGRVAL